MPKRLLAGFSFQGSHNNRIYNVQCSGIKSFGKSAGYRAGRKVTFLACFCLFNREEGCQLPHPQTETGRPLGGERCKGVILARDFKVQYSLVSERLKQEPAIYLSKKKFLDMSDIPLPIREKTTNKLFKRALYYYYLAQY